jgi:ankyrin repeat protein
LNSDKENKMASKRAVYKAIILTMLIAGCVFSAHPANAGVYEDLVLAAKSGDLVAVTRFIANGVDVNAGSELGAGGLCRTPLCAASVGGHNDVVKFLLDNGAHVDAVDGLGWTPLIWACASPEKAGVIDVVQSLINAGADVNFTVPDSSMTPLWQTARSRSSALMHLLIANGASATPGSPPRRHFCLLAGCPKELAHDRS